MIGVFALKEWLGTLDPDVIGVAVDNGGLTLVAMANDGQVMGAYIEVGGIPEPIVPEEELQLVIEQLYPSITGAECDRIISELKRGTREWTGKWAFEKLYLKPDFIKGYMSKD